MKSKIKLTYNEDIRLWYLKIRGLQKIVLTSEDLQNLGWEIEIALDAKSRSKDKL